MCAICGVLCCCVAVWVCYVGAVVLYGCVVGLLCCGVAVLLMCCGVDLLFSYGVALRHLCMCGVSCGNVSSCVASMWGCVAVLR